MKKLNTNHQVSQRLLESSSRGGAWMRMFFMLVIMMMSSAFAMAQGKYGFKVAGVDVTNDNYLDLTEINGVSGKVYFDPNTRTLTLDNATIEADDINAIRNETCDYLTIELIGTNTINVTGVASGMTLEEETTIWSNCGGKLSVKSDRCAVLFRGCPLEISNCWLEAEGAWGISANDNVAEEVLKIRNSHVEATGSKGSICDIANLVLEGCSITQPNGAEFDAKNNAVALNGKKVTDKVVIAPDSYDVQIAGVDVTSLNCKDLSVIDGVDGKISYDPETNTLTMEDVTINATDIGGIVNNNVEDLKIEVVGNNTITSSKACIALYALSTISGSGTLRLKSSGDCGIYMKFSPITVEGVKLYAEGKWGIAGYDGKSGEILTLRNAYVEATGSKGSVCDLQNLVLDGCSITQPTGAAFNVHAVVLNGDVVTDKVVIEPDSYGVRIADVDVTALNCKDLSVIDGVDGKMSYDPETKTLTMEDVTLNPAVTIAIVNEDVMDMKINLVGNNTITAKSSCIRINRASTISGSGTLRLNSSENCGIYMDKSSLTVEGVKLYAEGKWGIAGDDGKSGEILTLRNAYVEATGSKGSVCDLQNLVLDGCSITQPTGAAFNVHAVVLNGDVVTDKVVIEPSASGISDITTDVPAHAKGIYSVTGVKQTRQWNELPAGIYIVDGVKRVKR